LLTFEIRAPHADVSEESVKVGFALNGIPMADYELEDNEWHNVELDPAGLPMQALPDFNPMFLDGLTGILEVTCDRLFVPAQHSDSADKRRLGIGVSDVRVVR
jgi:hypothetical protein